MEENKKSWHYTEDGAKVVTKPWGREVWVNYENGENVGDVEKRYVMKKLYIKAGTKTSYQYHVKKEETNFLIEGEVEAWMENDEGIIEKEILKAGTIWSIPAGKKHRILPLTDIVLMECSSPEVDDVVRMEDDTGRGSGRIQDEHIKGNKFNKSK